MSENEPNNPKLVRFPKSGDLKLGIIYKLTNKSNGKCYIGQTRYCLDRRLNSHIKGSKSNPNSLIHKAIKKYGIDNFEKEVLGVYDSKDLDKFEVEHISKFGSSMYGYNLTKGGDGLKPNDILRDKLRMSHLGKTRSQESIEKQKNTINNPSYKIRVYTKERGNKISLRTKGKKKRLSDKRKEELSRPKSYDVKCKISKTLTGRELSESHKNSISLSLMGHKVTEKTKEKMRKPKPFGFSVGEKNGFFGKSHSEVSREKMRAAKNGAK